MKTAPLLAVLISACLAQAVREDCTEEHVTVDYQGEGYWQGRILLKVTEDVSGWEVAVGFSAEVETVHCSLASVSGSGTQWTLSSFSWDDDLHGGSTLEVGIVVHYSGAAPAVTSLALNGQSLCSGSGPTSTSSSTSVTSTATTPAPTSSSGGCGDDYIVDAEEAGQWQGRLMVTVPDDVSGWEIQLSFSASVDLLECSLAQPSGSGQHWRLSSYEWDGELEAGTVLEVGILLHYSGARPSLTGLTFNDLDLCSDSSGTTTPPTSTTTSSSSDCSDSYAVDSEEEGEWQGRVLLTPPLTLAGWTVRIEFSAELDTLDCSLAAVSGSGSVWSLTSYDWDSDLEAGVTLEVGIIVHYSGAQPDISSLSLNEMSLCSSDSAPTTSTSSHSPTSGVEECDADDVSIDEEMAGSWQGRLLVQVPEAVSSWVVKVHFTEALDSLDCSLAAVSGAGQVFTLSSYDWDGDLEGGTVLEVGIIAHYSGNKPAVNHVIFNEVVQCSGGEGPPPTQTTPHTTTSHTGEDCNDEYVIDTDAVGMWQGRILLAVPQTVSGWEVKIHFNTDLTDLDCALASVSGSGSLWSLTSYSWDGDIEAGTTLEIGIIVHFSQSRPFINNIIFNETPYCSGGYAPTTEHPTPTTSTETTSTTTKSTSTSTTRKSTTTSHSFTECPNLEVTNEWQAGYNAELTFQADHDAADWDIYLSFDKSVGSLQIWQGDVSTSDNINFRVHNLDWDGDLSNGDSFTLFMIAYFSEGHRPNMVSATFDDQDICN